MNSKMLESLVLSDRNRLQGEGANADQIAAAERELDVKLVGSYRKFLQIFGWLEVDSTEVFGLGADVPKHLDLVAITQSERTEMRPRLRKNLVPVMNDGGGNLLCIDLTSGNNEGPPVVFWDHELGPDQEPELYAPTFEEWLAARV